MSNQEFRNLVFKDQKLTPKVWKNIKPKVEMLVEARRNTRLQGVEYMKRQWRINRENAIRNRYHGIGIEVMNLPFGHDRLSELLPKIDDVFALPSIKALLEVDTQTITEDQWIEVAPDVRLFALKWWRDCLEQFAGRLEHGVTGSDNETQAKTKAECAETETVEAVSVSIEGLRAKLSYATAVFSCEDYHLMTVYRFPHVINHFLGVHSCRSMDEILDNLRPLQPNGQELVTRLLKDLKLDPETAKLDPPVEDQNEKNLLCTRCDERVAKYMSFDQMIEHFIESQTWFESVTESVRTSPEVCYPSRPVGSRLPKIVNDHDWTYCDALLVRQDDHETKETVLKLQSDFCKGEPNDLFCDTEGSEGEDLENDPFKLGQVVRSCLLCPEFYTPDARQRTRLGTGYDVGESQSVAPLPVIILAILYVSEWHPEFTLGS
ncbi:hypothetical protein FRC01_002890 [Tulasnella sp. 417]|nr:hypothetical protein FRC01_002890 [Tulasnella sp. 417]